MEGIVHGHRYGKGHFDKIKRFFIIKIIENIKTEIRYANQI